jgi:hypothetical protein
MNRSRKLTTLIACGYLILSSSAVANVVSDWNEIARQTIIIGAVPARPGPSAVLDFAVVQAAVHDAIQAYTKNAEPYAVAITNAAGSPIAAAAVAAHDVLVHRFPAQAANLNTRLMNYLSGLGLTGDPGAAVGHLAAAAIINLRANDGSFPPTLPPFLGGTAPGEWRPTLPAFAPMATPWLATVTPFTLKDPTQLRPSPPPPALNSGEYTHDYNEVKALGSVNSTVRTQAQTDLASFYAGNFIDLWQRALQDIVNANLNDNLAASARLFALADLASADAVIGAWDTKKYYFFWRPITAIQEGDNDGNPQTVGDPSWLPFIPTPPYPEYSSGANNLTASIMRTLELYFGDKLTFNVISTAVAVNNTRTYYRFSDVMDDVVNVRIYQGIHFRSADEVARRTGARAADWAFSHFLRPLK